MNAKSIRYYALGAGGVLLAGALGRFWLAWAAAYLPLHDPLLGLPGRELVWLAGALELGVALVCLFGRALGLKTVLLAWLGTNFLVYQIGLVQMGYPLRYGCLGSQTDPLRLGEGLAGAIMGGILLCLLLGGYAGCFWLWFTKAGKETQRVEAMSADQRDAAAGLLKMSCPACGGHIQFARQNLGRKIPCPHCKTETILRKPDNLKMTCFFCQGHIEFPAHAIGTKMACPHCNMDITLKESL